MNVAIFAESLGSGGISSYCLELVSALQEMPGINPYLVGINDNRWRWLIDRAASRGVKLNEIHLSGRFDWGGLRKIHTFIVGHQIEVVHTQAYRLNILVRLTRLAYRTPVKLVNTVHGVYAFRTAKVMSWAYYLLDYATFGFSDGLIAVSSTTARQLISWHIPKARSAVVIPNGVRSSLPMSDIELNEMRSRIGISGRETTVGFVGRLSSEKGIEFLCKIIRGLIRKDCKYQFVIIGDGPLRYMVEELRGKWPDNVVYLGEQDDVNPYFQLMGLLLVTSQTEGMPMTIIEGFSHGVPVISTKVGGVPEVVIDGITGFLCEFGDSEEMIKNIDFLLSDNAMRSKIASNCLDHYSRKRSSRVMAEQTFEVYKDVMDIKRS